MTVPADPYDVPGWRPPTSPRCSRTSPASRRWLDEDALHEILSPVIRNLAAVAESHGGYVAKYAADALLVFFGIPEPRDDDAERACRVALDMHAVSRN